MGSLRSCYRPPKLIHRSDETCQIKIALIAGPEPRCGCSLRQATRAREEAALFIAMSSLFSPPALPFEMVAFPSRVFVNFTTDYLTFMPRVEPAFSMYLRLILALGITFQLPTLVLFLARMGMITPRFMLRNFKFAVLLIAIATAVLSPDGGGVGMVAMGGPVILLYVLSIGPWAFGKGSRHN
jgi:sec-independent protein translocase protein TatC